MANSPLVEFTDAVWTAAASLESMSAPRVADHIIKSLFPQTVNAAEGEGAFPIFRNGVLVHVRKVLSAKIDEEGQMSIFDIDERLVPTVEQLKRGAYYVQSLDEYVSVSRLVKEVSLLDEARKYMRRKGNETLSEADALDGLFKAVCAVANDNISQLARAA